MTINIPSEKKISDFTVTPQQFSSIPKVVEAILVTRENIDTVVKWVHGWTIEDRGITIVWLGVNGINRGAKIGNVVYRFKGDEDFKVTSKKDFFTVYR